MGPFFQLPSNEETSELKTADAAVFALKGRRQTMEDRFALVQIPVPHLPNENIVRLFCVMDGHGGQVRNTFHNMSDNISEFDFLRLLELCKVVCHPRYSTRDYLAYFNPK